MAGALAPADERDRVQARLVGPEDDRRLRRAGAEPRAAAPAADADRRRHPRGRARASGTAGSASCCASCTSRRGADAARPQAARPQGAGRRRARHELAELLGWNAGRFARACRRLPDSYWIAERPKGSRQCAPDRRGRSAHRRAEADRSHAEYYPERGATWSAVFATTTPGLFYRIAGGDQPGRRATSSTRASTPRATAWRSTISWSRTRAAGRCRPAASSRGWRGDRDALPATSRRPPPTPLPLPRRAQAFAVAPAVFDRNKASSRYTVIEVNARDRPALLAGSRRRSRRGSPGPFGPYRHLWRARGRRLLSDRPDGGKIDARRKRRACAHALLEGRRRGLKPAMKKGPAGCWRGPFLESGLRSAALGKRRAEAAAATASRASVASPAMTAAVGAGLGRGRRQRRGRRRRRLPDWPRRREAERSVRP